MIDLYTWTTPNGRKVSIMLEELGAPYRVHAINLSEGHQHRESFRNINPNERIPAIVDQDAAGGPLTVFESGAILIYLAEKSGCLLPTEVRARTRALQWLMFQMAGIGPMLGQAGHFATQAPEKIPYAITRYTDESLRLMAVLDRRLTDRDYLAGDYSIADIASYPWVIAAWPLFKAMPPEQAGPLDHVEGWLERVGKRPAVQAGMKVPVL
ncbi:MAG: glutathione S-transferase N-terminal domain-containing protein [bacterium]